MNAKELAALAALGIGGAYLYNRNKDSDSGKPAGMPEYQGRTADRLADIQNEYGKEPEMPAYQGRTADRLADIQNEYGKAPAAPAAPAQDLEGRRTSMAIAPAAKKPAARPAARPTTQVAAPAGNPKLNSLRETKPRNFDPAQYSSEIISQKIKNSLNRQLDDDKAEKKAAATANSQAIIDRMAKRTRPYLKDEPGNYLKRGGAVKKMASGGTASSRGDGIAQRGKTRGKMY
jgi:hypothetical protein